MAFSDEKRSTLDRSAGRRVPEDMKLRNLVGWSLLGMALCGSFAYVATPDGGLGTSARAATGDFSFGSGASDRQGRGDVDKPTEADVGRFTSGAKLMLTGRAGHARILQGSSGQTFALLEITGEGDGAPAVASKSDLSIVIDRSGSMRGTRIRNALSAATKAVQHLREGDTVSVVAFDQRSEVIVPRTSIDESTRAMVLRRIDGIGLGGDTCISCGITDGLGQLGRSLSATSRMILLSDGDANRGLRDVSAFRSLGAAARSQGVTITTIGVDVDFNEKLLAAVSAESNGRLVFVENDGALDRAFEEETNRLTTALASNAEVTIDLPEGVDLIRVYDRTFQREGRTLRVPIGSLNKGDVRTVLLELRADTRETGPLTLANVKMTYRDLAADRDAECRGTLRIERTDDSTQVSALDPVVLSRLQRVETASVLREVNQLVESGRPDEARRRLEKSSGQLANLAASAATATGRSGEQVRKDLADQQASLAQAKAGVAAAPVAASPGAAPPPMPRAVRARMKANAVDAFESGF
jgi:Ca-activated chloride channel homolog